MNYLIALAGYSFYVIELGLKS